MSEEEFTSIALNIFVPALMFYMMFILYRLGKESNAGNFGMFVLFLSLGMGLVGFAAKSVIQLIVNV